MTHTPLRVVTAQKGARDHYLIPRVLHRRGALAHCIVDWHASPTLRRWAQAIQNPLLQRAARAFVPDIAEQKISDMKPVAVLRILMEAVGRVLGRRHAAYAWTDALFARRVAATEMPPHDVFIGYSYASLEALKAERKRGVFTVVHQIDPGRFEWRLVQREAAEWPAYAHPKAEEPDQYFRRAEREWEVADLIVVNSEWSRRALEKQGASPEKLHVLPLGYEPPPKSRARETASQSPPEKERDPLTVLWLGTVSIRKGIPYFVEAARRLRDANVEFLVAGSIAIRTDAVTAAPDNIEWLGHIPRTQVPQLFRRADVHVLPTLSDGFGMSQLEAMAHGVPVVATPNCGRVVEDGKTGCFIEPRSAEALAEVLLRLEKNRAMLQEMAARCVDAASQYTIDAYGERLYTLLREHMD